MFVNLQKRSCRYELQRNNKSRSQPAAGAQRPSLAAAAAGRQVLDRGQAGLGSVWTRTNSQSHVGDHPEAKETTGGQNQTKRGIKTEAGIKNDVKSFMKMGMISFPVLINARKKRTAQHYR